MQTDYLAAISPIDGRYAGATRPLSIYFSEEALIRYRVRVEAEYFIALTDELPDLKAQCQTGDIARQLRALYRDFTSADAVRVKEIESITNHDVKAVEYFLKEKFSGFGSDAAMEFVHFGLTSQDINNTACPMMLREAMQEVILPMLRDVTDTLEAMALQWRDIPMLAKTHGQPASPTRLGKEIKVFAYRLQQQFALLATIPYSGKFGGATGNFNAHYAAYPDHDWPAFADRFLADTLGLTRERFTTQISNYDNMAALFDGLSRVNTILLDLCRDMWSYISMDYFKQRIKAGEVGSSAMPHKVNPIDFENAEGNLGLANAILGHLARKLPVSRLQRDLTDSTVIRNIGVPLAHMLIALNSLAKGLGKLILNPQALESDLARNFAVVAEAVQTILRREGYPKPYEALKELTRTGLAVTPETLGCFIDDLNVSDSVKEELRAVTPANYLGIY